MPPRARRPCRQPMCPAKTQERHGYCEAHGHLASGWNQPGRQTAEARGYGWAWRKLAKAVLKRDRYLCQCEDCQGVRLTASEVDHIVLKAAGGTDDPSNLRAINTDCHAAKTRREAAAARRGEYANHRRT